MCERRKISYGRILTRVLGSQQKQGTCFRDKLCIFGGVLNTLTLYVPTKGEGDLRKRREWLGIGVDKMK